VRGVRVSEYGRGNFAFISIGDRKRANIRAVVSFHQTPSLSLALFLSISSINSEFPQTSLATDN